MATGLMVDLIRARCGQALKGDPITSDLDRAVYRDYQKVLREAAAGGAGAS